MRTTSDSPIVALDIDGTIAEYYEHFRWFAELYLQRSVVVDWSRSHRGEFSDALGLDKNLYRQIKLAYRQGGMKRCIPEKDGAGDLVRLLRKKNVSVWICTTRPWNRLDNIDPDTQFWIDRTLGRVDGVIYGEDKYQDLLEIVGKRPVLAVADDLPENIAKAKALSLEAILLSGKHNEWFTETQPVNPGHHTARNISELKYHLLEIIKKHEKGK